MICIKDIEAIDHIFKSCLQFIKPGDDVLLCSVVDNGDPVGDTRSTRFGLGGRCRWVAGAEEDPMEPCCVGWNDDMVKALEDRMNELLKISQVPGNAS